MHSFSIILALSCLMFIILTIIVIRHRRRSAQALGNAQNDTGLERAIRTHGNFTEMTPFALGSLWLLSEASISESFILTAGMLFLIGRLSHAASVLCFEEKLKTFKFRIFGMMTSFMLILSGPVVYFLRDLGLL